MTHTTPIHTAVKGSDCVVFLDWEEGALIRRIDVAPRNVYWNETGELVLLACDESYFGAWIPSMPLPSCGTFAHRIGP